MRLTQENMNALITMVLVPVLIACVTIFQQYASAKASEAKERVKNENTKKYIDIANDAVCTAVGAVAQVMVDGLKKVAENGVLTDEDARNAFEEAKSRSLAIMGTAGREAVRELYGDFDQWLANKIEFYVGANKARSALRQKNVLMFPAENGGESI